MTITSAPAKIILCGEHAVVYGSPAIAIPVFGLRAKITIHKTDSDELQILAKDTKESLTSHDTDHPLIIAATTAFKSIHQHGVGLKLILESDIPISSGLGSGAAVTTAIIKSIYQHFDVCNDYAKINNLVFEIEKLHHGTPSGIDNTVIVYEKPIYFIKGKKPILIEPSGKFHFLIGDTGNTASTKSTVAHVRSLYETSPQQIKQTWQDIHELVDQIKTAITGYKPATLGKAMSKNHELLQSIGVSTSKLDLLVKAALSAGALGAKLSGGGGGGNMIALVPENKLNNIRDALLQAGANKYLQPYWSRKHLHAHIYQARWLTHHK